MLTFWPFYSHDLFMIYSLQRKRTPDIVPWCSTLAKRSKQETSHSSVRPHTRTRTEAETTAVSQLHKWSKHPLYYNDNKGCIILQKCLTKTQKNTQHNLYVAQKSFWDSNPINMRRPFNFTTTDNWIWSHIWFILVYMSELNTLILLFSVWMDVIHVSLASFQTS